MMLKRARRSQRRTAARTVVVPIGVVLAWALIASSLSAQRSAVTDGSQYSLEKVSRELNARLVGLERAQGVLFGALIEGNGKVDEADIFRRMTRRLSDTAAAARPDPEADLGFAALGTSGAAVIRRAHAFHRQVVAIVASTPPRDHRRQLDAAVMRYRSAGRLALPDAPKDMTILYDHPYTSFVPPATGETEPRRELSYPMLTGFVWSAHWYELAVIEPLQHDGDTIDRSRDLATVAERLERKLSAGEPPDGFPTELPLAPAIASGLVAVHERTASIIDNLNILQDVIADVLVRPTIADRRQVVNGIVAQFTDRRFRCVQADEWIVVALRHSIFAQGGPPLGIMKTYERNAFSGGHGQHYAVRRGPPPCDPE
jgi:hypothetical protein